MKHQKVIQAEMKPCFCESDECDQMIPLWEVKGSDFSDTNQGPMILRSEHFPPGTKITIEVPCCPECGASSDQDGEPQCFECGFDWRGWAKKQYG